MGGGTRRSFRTTGQASVQGVETSLRLRGLQCSNACSGQRGTVGGPCKLPICRRPSIHRYYEQQDCERRQNRVLWPYSQRDYHTGQKSNGVRADDGRILHGRRPDEVSTRYQFRQVLIRVGYLWWNYAELCCDLTAMK